MSVEIHMKGKAKEELILEVLKAYERVYPRKMRLFRQQLKQLREVTIARRQTAKGRDIGITMRVPTEPYLFLQSLMPEFGEDSRDIDLLVRLWDDFARVDKRKRTRIW